MEKIFAENFFLAERKISPKKKFGPVFLVDKNLAKSFCDRVF